MGETDYGRRQVIRLGAPKVASDAVWVVDRGRWFAEQGANLDGRRHVDGRSGLHLDSPPRLGPPNADPNQ